MSIDRISFLLSALAAVFLAFLAGSILTFYKLPPYDWISDASEAYIAYNKRAEIIENELPKTRNIGFNPKHVLHLPEAFDGYTLYAIGSVGTEAVLVDMEGQIVHRWSYPFYKAWPNAGRPENPGEPPLPERLISWICTRLMPNGDLLANYTALGTTPYGLGIVKLDKDSNLIWKYDEQVNHFFDVEHDGTIHALIHHIVPADKFLGKLPGAEKKVLEDSVVTLSPDGKELQRISLTRAMMNSPYRALMNPLSKEENEKKYLNPSVRIRIHDRWDILHPNSVRALRPGFAQAFPMFKPGQLLISLRRLDALIVLDPVTEKVIWLAQGPWRQQHDAHFLRDGTIMMFDNWGAGDHSRILKYDPQTSKTTVVYEGPPKKPLMADIQGADQMLPNGNLLVTESYKGKISEIKLTGDGKGKVVWKFFNPYRSSTGEARVIFVGTRYAPKAVPFLTNEVR